MPGHRRRSTTTSSASRRQRPVSTPLCSLVSQTQQPHGWLEDLEALKLPPPQSLRSETLAQLLQVHGYAVVELPQDLARKIFRLDRVMFNRASDSEIAHGVLPGARMHVSPAAPNSALDRRRLLPAMHPGL